MFGNSRESKKLMRDRARHVWSCKHKHHTQILMAQFVGEDCLVRLVALAACVVILKLSLQLITKPGYLYPKLL